MFLKSLKLILQLKFIVSEVPGGSGLGSSGAFTASLIKFLSEYKKIKMSDNKLQIWRATSK